MDSRSRKNKQFAIFVLLIGLVFIICFNIYEKLSDKKDIIASSNEIERLFTKSSVNTSSNGKWIIDARWIDNTGNSDIVISDSGDSLSYKPLYNSKDTALTLAINLTGDNYETCVPFDAGAFNYYLPLIPFDYTGTYGYDLYSDDTNNKVVILDSIGNEIGEITFSSNTYHSSIADSEWGDKYAWDVVDNELVITNVDEVDCVYYPEVYVNYSFYPSVIGPSSKVNNIYFSDGVDKEVFSTVKSEILSTVTFDNYSTSYSDLLKYKLYAYWNNKWGDNPFENDDVEYMFIEYTIKSGITSTDDYTRTVDFESDNGSLVLFSDDGVNYDLMSYDEYLNSDKFSVDVSLPSHESFEYHFVVSYPLYGEYDFRSNLNIAADKNYFRKEEFIGDLEKAQLDNESYTDADITEPQYPTGTANVVNLSVSDDSASTGAINKLKGSSNVEFEFMLEPTAEAINKATGGKTVKAFNNYENTNNGSDDYTLDVGTNGIYYDDSYSNNSNIKKLTNANYNITKLTLIDDIEYDYVVSGKNYILDEVTEYNDYSSKDVFVKVSNNSWEKIGSYVNTADGIEFVATYSGVNFDDLTNTINLPINVTDVKITYTGNRSAVYIGFKYTVKVVGNSELVTEINNITSQNKDFVIKANGNVSVNNNLLNVKTKGTILTEFKSNSVYDITSSKVNNDGVDEVTFDIKYYDYINAGSSSVSDVMEYLNKQDNGKFYILIPKGIDYKSLVVYDADGNILDTSKYSVYNHENYYDDRRLLNIIINNTDNISSSNNTVKSGYTVRLVFDYTRENNIKYGNILNIDAAYLGKNIGAGKLSFDDYNDSAFTAAGVKSSFKNDVVLDFNFNTLLFKSSNVTLNKAIVLSGSLSNSVSGSSNSSYGTTANAIEGAKYTYKIEYTFGDPYEELNNAVIYDVLDSSSGSTFKGVLDSIDTSYLDDNDINYTVYYSVKAIDVNTTDLTNNSMWTTVMPSDKAAIKAIAIKFNSKLYGNDVKPIVYVKMVAPLSNGTGLVAKNNSVIKFNDGVKDKSLDSNVTSVTLEKSTLSLNVKAMDSEDGNDITVGSSLPGSYGYLYTIDNSSTVEFNNVVLNLNIPKSLIINEDGIKTYVNNIETSGVSYSVDNNVITANINRIGSNGMTIWIPVSFDVSNLDNNTSKIIVNGSISKVNNIDINSDPVSYENKVSIPNINYGKYVNTLDTGIYSDASTPVLITPSEKYSYMIEINNISDVSAKNIVVVDNVPNGVNVNDISNGGLYDSSSRTITWTIGELKSLSTIDLEYSVTVSNDIPLKTVYSTKGHVTLVNPLDSKYNLVDNDTNTISVIYQIASDVKVNNVLDGKLADKNKEFTYKVDLDGSSDDKGTYSIVDTKGTEIKTITVNEEGKGSTTFKIKGNNSFTIKLLPGDVDYYISQSYEDGYVTTIDDVSTNNINGTTSEERLVTYTFKNAYDVSSNVNLNAYVTYNNGLAENQFDFVLTDMNDNIIETVSNDNTGKVSFTELTYENEDGLKQYKVKQVSGNNSQIVYDGNIYTIGINLVNDGKGNLNSVIKYYDKLNNLVDNMLFENSYVPTGFVIGNSNISDYVDTNKVFKYKLELTSDKAGTYNVLDNVNNILDTINIDDTGIGTYEFELGNDKQIIISDLPVGTTYKLIQYNEKYYTSNVVGSNYSVDVNEDSIFNTGEVVNGTIKVIFSNKYSTKASYKPSVNVTYEDGVFEGNEFSFLLTDVSEGVTNGYSELISNDENGKITFKDITYTKPGEYKYVISQIKGDSNHVYYDNAKCYLTLLLSDNGDGTMSYSYEYLFDNDALGFKNKYSFEEINKVVEEVKPEEDKKEEQNVVFNPNTGVFGKILLFVTVALMAFVLLVLQRKVKLRKFE